MSALEHEIDRYCRDGTALSVIMLNIDHFQAIKETSGNQVGDAIMEKTALLVRQLLLPQDTLERSGSGEFMLVLPDTDNDRAYVLARKIQSLFTTTPFVESRFKFTISASIATWERRQVVDPIQEAVDNCLLQRTTG